MRQNDFVLNRYKIKDLLSDSRTTEAPAKFRVKLTKIYRSNRADFSSKTKELAAKRAGYRCSFPGCSQLTVGPNKHPEKSSNIGIAAHIYGAAISGGGPRGTGGLSDDELKSPQNAIWLCSHHANLIDKNGGEDFPPDKLFSYKALHEARIAHELSGILTPFGWVDKMTVCSSPITADKIEIDFAKLTLISGGNSVGKTALCQWLAAASQPQHLERWARVTSGREKLSIEVDYHNPEPHKVSVSFLSDRHPEYKIDEIRTTISTAPIKVVYPQPIYFTGADYNQEDRPNDLELISNILNLHPYEVRALCEEIKPNSPNYIKRVFFEEYYKTYYMFVEIDEDVMNPCRFRQLSGSQSDRVIMELGTLASNQFAVSYPTVLILDSGSAGLWRFDDDWLKHYSNFLGSPECKFQTFITMIPERANITKSIWDGWKIIELVGSPPNTRIRIDN